MSYTELTTFEGQDFNPVWISDSKLLFLSAQSGRYNIWSLEIDESGKAKAKPAQITKYDEDGIMYFSASKDGKMIAFQVGTDVFTANSDGSNIKKFDIKIGTDYRFDPVERKTYSNRIQEYSVSPNGKYSAFIIHGEVFITENNKEKKLTKNLSKTSTREKDVAWLNDSTLTYRST